MIKDTNIYSKDQAISLATKIGRLQELKVPFEVKLAKGIGGEKVVSLSWNASAFEEALYEEEEF